MFNYNKRLQYLNTIDTTERMILLLADVRNEKQVLKIEEEIEKNFNNAKVIRYDVDTTKNQNGKLLFFEEIYCIL